MNVPEKSHQLWRDIVTGAKAFELKSLAAKMVLGSLTHSVRENPTPENIEACIGQLHEVFAQNAHAPSVQDDLKTIFG
jgi:hypothetical protein